MQKCLQCHLVDPALTPDSGLLRSPNPGHNCPGLVHRMQDKDGLLPSPPRPFYACSAPFFPPQLLSPPLDLAHPLPLPGTVLSSLHHPSQPFLPFCEVHYHHHLLWYPSPTPADQHLSVCLSFKALITHDSFQALAPPGSSPWGRGQHHAVHLCPHPCAE